MIKAIILGCCILLIVTQTTAQSTSEEIIINKTYFGFTLPRILRDISSSYGLDMDYKPGDVKSDIIPGKHYKNQTLKDVLDELTESFNLTYKIVDRQVIIRKKGTLITAEEKKYPRKFDFTISGIIKDKASGESLPFAQVLIQGSTIGTSTNVDGYFTLFNVPADTSVLEVVYVGYNKKYLQLTPKLVSQPLIIEMVFQAKEIEGVTITADRMELLRASEQISTISLTPRDIASLPSLGEKDIFRSFQLLPGISGSNESSAGLYVRGGTPDQNLILYDGFTVYHQEHLFGMYSAFNSNAIKDVKLYKGGFESKYGGRLSSVMEIIGKTGNENQFNLGGDISLMSFNAYTEIPLGGKGSVFIAGRKSYQGILYDRIFDAFQEDNSNNTPQNIPVKGNRTIQSADPNSYFYDLNAKLTYRLTTRDIVSLSFFNGQDDLDNSREMNRAGSEVSISGGMTDLTKWGNWGSSLKWSRKWSEKFYMNNLLSYSNYYSERDMRMSRTIESDSETITFNRGTLEDNDLKDFSWKSDMELKTGVNNQIEFGLQATHYDIAYDYIQNDTVGILNINEMGNEVSAYLQDKWQPFDKLHLTSGLRTTYYDITGKFYVQPRFQLTYDLGSKIKLKGSWGIFNQFANRVIREDIMSGSRDFWILSDGADIPVSESIHYVLGASYETNNFLFDVEAYHKELSGLSEYTLRFAPAYGELDYNSFFYEGNGFAQGIEFLAQKKFGKLTGWIGYTLGQVLYNFPVYGEGYFPATHDVTHEFKLVSTYKWKKWIFAGTWIYATGKPYTEPLGGYTLTLPDGSIEDFIVTGPKNGSRYPDYHRLDLSANYEFPLGKTGIGSIGFSLFNVYNRQNVWYKEFEVDEAGLLETDINLLGITPNVTLSLKLR